MDIKANSAGSPLPASREARWEDHHGEVVDSKAGFDVVHCRSCGFRHITPIPSPEELDRIYREEYYSLEKPLYIERYQEDLDWWNLVYEERYLMLEQLLQPERRRILDIGSGPGFFLLNGKKRGWETLGFEPSSQSAAFSTSLGLDIRNTFLTAETAAELGTFDVVHLCNVLEHLRDPAEMIAIAKSLLNPGGLLFIVVPNDYNPLQELLRGNGHAPWWVAPPHHINFFDFDTLQSLLARLGFDTLERHTTFPMELFLLMGENYIGNDKLGRECHLRRKQLEGALATPQGREIKQKLYDQMAHLGIGREIVMIARPKGDGAVL